MTVIVKFPNNYYQIDTPDTTLIGPWLASLFKDFPSQLKVGLDIRIEIRP